MTKTKGPSQKSLAAARAAFQASEGILRTSEALAAGIHARTLYWMRDTGQIDALSRGVWHLSSETFPSTPDAASVMRRVPRAVLCLVSALEFHEIGTQIPSAVQIALPQGTKSPRIHYPRVQVFWLSISSFEAGIEEHMSDGSIIRVYSLAKTIADLFKFRNRIGQQIAVEALREAISSRRTSPAEIMRFAKVDRVERHVRPYLEFIT